MPTNATRTICCKLSLTPEALTAIQATAVAFNAAATFCAQVAWTERLTNRTKLHRRVYGPTRSLYGLGAQLACCARDKAAEAVRAARANGAPACPTFRPDSSIRYDARTYRLLPGDRVSLNTIAGRVTGQLVLGAYQRQQLADPRWTTGGAELVQRDGMCFLHLTQSMPLPEPDAPTGVLGIDLGIVNLAADSDGATYSGADVQRVRTKRFRHRQRLQTVNTRRARWRLRQNARRESRFQRDVNHCISKRLVAKARTSRKALAVEDLTQIRARVTVRREQRRARHAWAFRQLRTFLSYKAVQAGVLVVVVDPRDTSRTCAVCGYCDPANRVVQARFHCQNPDCGHTAAADTNAAVNIANRAARQTAYRAAPTSVGGASTSPRRSGVGV
jgi:IS605 OrfB family transposase